MYAFRNLTIVVPAYNEERTIEKTVSEVHSSAACFLEAFEVIIVDDGSHDRTGELADELASTLSPHVKVVHFQRNRGVGAAFQEGLRLARYPYITLIPGDNAFTKSGIARMFSQVGASNLIISYRANFHVKTTLRRWLSGIVTLLVRGLTGRQIRDAHSLFVFPVDLARRIELPKGYGYHLECLCRLLLMAPSYIEVPVELNQGPDQSSGVMRVATLARLAGTVSKLCWLRITGRLVDEPGNLGRGNEKAGG